MYKTFFITDINPEDSKSSKLSTKISTENLFMKSSVHVYFDTGEREIEEDSPVRSQLKTPDGKRPSIFLRYKELDSERGYIKVYPGGLRCVFLVGPSKGVYGLYNKRPLFSAIKIFFQRQKITANYIS